MALPTYHVPADLADELLEAGLAERPEYKPVVGGEAFFISGSDAANAALIFLNVSGNLVALTGIRPPLANICDRIRGWAARPTGSGRHLSLLAVGPNGQLRLDTDSSPDPAALAILLESLYESEDDRASQAPATPIGPASLPRKLDSASD